MESLGTEASSALAPWAIPCKVRRPRLFAELGLQSLRWLRVSLLPMKFHGILGALTAGYAIRGPRIRVRVVGVFFFLYRPFF